MTQQKMVRLYYLGGLNRPGKKITVVRSRGRVITLPPPGEYLEVTEFTANDLIGRHKILAKGGVKYEAFTRNPQIAKRVKDAGTFEAQDASHERSMSLDDVFRKFTPEQIKDYLEEIENVPGNMIEVDEPTSVKTPVGAPVPAAAKKGAPIRRNKRSAKEAKPVAPKNSGDEFPLDVLDEKNGE